MASNGGGCIPGEQKTDSAAATDALVGLDAGRAKRNRLENHYLSAANAVKLAKLRTTVLIDPRSREGFDALHVADALNIPAYQLKTKSFLRGKRLLLVDEGFRYRELEHLVDRLRVSGFTDVSIVEGGLNAWHAEVGPLQGSANPNRLAEITAADFAKEEVYDHWRVVYLGAEDESDLCPLAYQALIPLNADPELLRRHLSELAAPGDGQRLRPLVLITSVRGEGYPRVQVIMKGAGLWNLFYLDGGMDAYATHLDRLQAMWSRDKQARAEVAPSCAVRR